MLYLWLRMLSFSLAFFEIKIVAAFRGMHVSPAKHSYASVTDGQTDRRTDRQMDGQTGRQTDDGQSDPYLSLCFAGDTKNGMPIFNKPLTKLHPFRKKDTAPYKYP